MQLAPQWVKMLSEVALFIFMCPCVFYESLNFQIDVKVSQITDESILKYT